MKKHKTHSSWMIAGHLLAWFLTTWLALSAVLPLKASAQDAVMQPDLRWAPAPRAKAYLVQVALDKEFKQMFRELRVTESRVSSNGFAAGNYFLRIAVIDASGQQSAFSGPLAVTILPEPLELVSPEDNFVADASQLKHKVLFVWDEIDGAKEYEIQISRFSNFSKILAGRTAESEISVMLNADGKPYYWRVIGHLNDGSQTYSATERKFTLRSFKAAPQLLLPPDEKEYTILSSRRASVLFTWKAIPNTKEYEFELARDSIEGVKVPVKMANHLSRRGDLTPGEYEWRVRALDASGSVGPWSAARKLKITGRLASPQIFFPKKNEVVYTRVLPSEVSIRWTGFSEDVSYEAQLSPDESFKTDVKSIETTKLQWKVVLNEGKFFVRVRASTANFQTSAWSKPFVFSVALQRNWQRMFDVFLGYNYAFETFNVKTKHASGSLGIPESFGLGVSSTYRPLDELAIQAFFSYRPHKIANTFFLENSAQQEIGASHSDFSVNVAYHFLNPTPLRSFGLWMFMGNEMQTRGVILSDIDKIDIEIEKPTRSYQTKSANLLTGGFGVQYINSLKSEARVQFKAGWKYGESAPKTSSYRFYEARGSYWQQFSDSLLWGVEPYVSYSNLEFDDTDLSGTQSAVHYGVLFGVGYWL